MKERWGEERTEERTTEWHLEAQLIPSIFFFFLHSQEAIVRLSLLPLRLNIDQDALVCLIKFFSFVPPPMAPVSSAEVWQPFCPHHPLTLGSVHR